MSISKKVRMLMNEKNVNQTKLAELLGKKQPQISHFLKMDDDYINHSLLKDIAKALNVSIDYFIEKEEIDNHQLSEPSIAYQRKELIPFIDTRYLDSYLKDLNQRLKALEIKHESYSITK